MLSIKCTALQNFYKLYNRKSSVLAFKDAMALQDFLIDKIQQESIDEIISIYKESVALIEHEIWLTNFDDVLIDLFHKVFQELEVLISLKGDDERYEFVIVIPVADRPQHLKSCLASILNLCKCFNYGGVVEGRYKKISVVIADDTEDEKNIIKNQEIAQHYNDIGLEVIYFGLDQQLEQIDRLSDNNKQALNNVLGEIDRSDFSHKGASRMRNIAYLKLNEMIKKDKKQLFSMFYRGNEAVLQKANGTGLSLFIIKYIIEKSGGFIDVESYEKKGTTFFVYLPVK